MAPSICAIKRAWLHLLGLGVALALSGCGMFNASGSIGPDLKPHLGAGISVPLGK